MSIGDIAAVYCEQAYVMRYLRMLSNSLVAGALATAYVVVLVLQLNPSLPLSAVRLRVVRCAHRRDRGGLGRRAVDAARTRSPAAARSAPDRHGGHRQCGRAIRARDDRRHRRRLATVRHKCNDRRAAAELRADSR